MIPPAPPLAVTVAICTHNRAALLRETLAGATRQSHPPAALELLVIDNRSTDDTAAIVSAFADAPHPPRRVVEPQPGLNHARNRAVAEARGAIIVFADDDLLVESDWVAALVAPFTNDAAHAIGCVGGEVVPVFPDGRPDWIADWHEPLAFRADAGPIDPPHSPMGANVAFRREALERAGPFATSLDRRGRAHFGGGDSDMIRRVRAAGFAVWFAPAARVRHQMPASRLTLRHAARHAFDSARSRVIARTKQGRAIGYLGSRLFANLLKSVVFAAIAALEAIVMRRDGAKKALVRAWRACGYVYQISRSLLGST